MANTEDSVAYVQMTEPHFEVGYGKLRVGQIVRADPDRADRWMSAGLAEKASKSDYEKFRNDRVETANSREAAFSSLNRDNRAALWDVSTHRDALSAPEEGLRAAREAGIPLVNVSRLRSEDGLPLAEDAEIEEILEARANLHPGIHSPLTEHAAASTSGGGSHYDMPMPLNPQAREQEKLIRENERNAQSATFLKENDQGTMPRGSARSAREAATIRRQQQADQGRRQRQAEDDRRQRQIVGGTLPPPPPSPAQQGQQAEPES
jgi:hypothetical protein